MVTETEIAALAVAPRVTLQDVEDNIYSEHYFTAKDGALFAGDKDIPESLGLLTICVLVLRNGFTVRGESACASKENYNETLGKELARKDAVGKLWGLMGYELRTKLNLINSANPPSKSGGKTYVGTKVVHAYPMTRGAYNDLRDWAVPEDEEATDEGYLVEYADSQTPNVEGYAGYVSWSPKDVFERSYSTL